MRPLYRIRQMWRAVTAAPLSADAWQAVNALLTPAEQALFQRFSHNDQQHSYRVMCLLRDNGHTQRSLLKAALLHDVGKTKVRMSLLERSAVVFLKALLPHTMLAGQADSIEQATRWQRPFLVLHYHPQWGAEMTDRAGSDPCTVALIRRHQDKVTQIRDEEDQLLSLLQWADDQN